MSNILVLEDDQNRIEWFQKKFPHAKIVETAQDCINALLCGEPIDLLFLDHDLGGETYVSISDSNTGSEVVRWMTKNQPPVTSVIVHSWNAPAAKKMTDTLCQYGYKAVAAPFGSFS